MEKIARLSMLSKKDAEDLKEEIEELMETVSILSELDAEELYEDKKAVLRKDEAEEENTDYKINGYFTVPRTVG